MGAAYSSPTAIEEFASKVRLRTDKPFDQFVHSASVRKSVRIGSTLAGDGAIATNSVCPAQFSPPQEISTRSVPRAVLRVNPAVFSFTFGLLPSEHTGREERYAADRHGNDAWIQTLKRAAPAPSPSGLEAAGHRGIFGSRRRDKWCFFVVGEKCADQSCIAYCGRQFPERDRCRHAMRIRRRRRWVLPA